MVLRQMRYTKRPQNICKFCGYTWFPRGKNLSRWCPYCGSRHTDIDLSDLYLGCGMIVAGLLLLGVLMLTLAL
jgi:hypothetical protein